MDTELQQVLRSVLKEELNPINERLSVIEKDVVELKQDITGLKQDTATMKNNIAGLKQDVAGLKQETKELKIDIAQIKLNQEKYHKDSVETLGEYTDRITEHFDDHTDALNKRVFDLEAGMMRFKKFMETQRN